MTDRLNYIYLLLILLVTSIFTGCVETNTDQSIKRKYSIYTMSKDDRELLLHTDSLGSGTIYSEKQGAKVGPASLYYDLIVKDGHYFRIDYKNSRFVKSEIKDGVLTEIKSFQLEGFSTCENYNWISPDTLLLLSFDQKAKQVRFAKMEVNQMTAIQGTVQIPAPFGIYNSLSIGFSKYTDHKLLVGYSYHTTKNLGNYTTSDTLYVEALSYPSMKSLGRSKDTRSTYPGGENSRQPHTFTDETGDFYFIACPGIAAGNHPDKPTGIFRIKKSENEIDPNYFFNISASAINNHGYGLWYIGEGKAIVRTERKGTFSAMKDHYKVPHFDFYLIDMITQSTSRLNLPLDKGTSRQCILVENGLVYITINSNSDGSYIWIYDPKTGSLKKGLKFDSNVDYILRLERLN